MAGFWQNLHRKIASRAKSKKKIYIQTFNWQGAVLWSKKLYMQIPPTEWCYALMFVAWYWFYKRKCPNRDENLLTETYTHINKHISCMLLPRPLSNDPRFIQCIYYYSHTSKHFMEIYWLCVDVFLDQFFSCFYSSDITETKRMAR